MSRNKLAQRSDGRFKVNYKDKQFYGKSKKEAEQFAAREALELMGYEAQ